MRIDLHTHSSVSDGTDTPADLVRKARAAELDVVALTDHDTFDGLDECGGGGEGKGSGRTRNGALLLAPRQQRARPRVRCRPASPAWQRRWPGARRSPGSAGRLLAKLAALGVPVTEAEVMAQVGNSPSVGRPHIADALIKAGHVADRQEAFDRFLADGGPAHVPPVRDRGGTWDRRWCTRPAASRSSLIRGVVAGTLLPPSTVTEQSSASTELDGIEVDHQDHDLLTRAGYVPWRTGLGALGDRSSDYHGTGKVDHDLGCNVTSDEVFTELRSRLRPAPGRLT